MMLANGLFVAFAGFQPGIGNHPIAIYPIIYKHFKDFS